MNRNKRGVKSFTKSMTLGIVLLSIVPLFVLGSVILFSYQSTNKTALENRIADSLNAADRLLQEKIDEIQSRMDIFSQNELIQSYLDQKTMSEFDQDALLRNMYGFVSNDQDDMIMNFISLDGMLSLSTSEMDRGYAVSNTNALGIIGSMSRLEKEGILTHVYRLEPEDFINAITLVKVMYYSDGNRMGYLVVDLSRSYLQNLFYPIRQTSSGFTHFILTSKTDLIMYNDSILQPGVGFFSADKPYLYVQSNNPIDLKSYEIVTKIDERLGIVFNGLVLKQLVMETNQPLIMMIVVVSILTLISSGLGGYLLSRKLSKPIEDLALTMKTMDTEDLNLNLELASRKDEIGEITRQFQFLLKRIEEYHKNEVTKQELLKESEIKALHSQIDPHFLYNTLDTIKWMAKLEGQQDISQMVSELGVLLKGSMDTKNLLTTVAEEVTFFMSYIYIQQQRYRDRSKIETAFEEEMMDVMIPKLILQPLVENAIIHGVEPLSRKGIININGWIDEQYLYFSIADNGTGTELTLDELLKQSKSIGLKNVYQRLKLYYGEKFVFNFISEPGKGTVVFFIIPRVIKEERHV